MSGDEIRRDPLDRLATAFERIAGALERAFPVVESLTPAEERELADIEDRSSQYAAEYAAEQTLAIVEMLEASGKDIPPEVYKRFGIDPPDSTLEEIDAGERAFEESLGRDQQELIRPSAGAHPPPDDEPVIYRKATS